MNALKPITRRFAKANRAMWNFAMGWAFNPLDVEEGYRQSWWAWPLILVPICGILIGPATEQPIRHARWNRERKSP